MKEEKIIEAYVNNALDAKAKAEFETRLENDEALQQKVKVVRLEQVAGSMLIKSSLKDKMATWKEEGKVVAMPVQAKRRSLRPVLSIAASFLILVSVIGGYLMNQYSDASIANRYYDPVLFESTKGTGEMDPFDQIGRALNEGDQAKIEEITKTLESLPADNPNYDKGLYYLGHVYYSQGQYDAAITAFNKVMNAADFEREARWYMALTYVKKGDKTNALKTLDTLDSYPAYTQRVADLKSEMNHFFAF